MIVTNTRGGDVDRLLRIGIRPQDILEWEKGLEHLDINMKIHEALEASMSQAVVCRSAFYEGELVAIWGITPQGCIWLIASTLADNPKVTARLHKHWHKELKLLTAGFTQVFCVPMVTNELHIKWLNILGFEEDINCPPLGENFKLFWREAYV